MHVMTLNNDDNLLHQKNINPDIMILLKLVSQCTLSSNTIFSLSNEFSYTLIIHESSKNRLLYIP